MVGSVVQKSGCGQWYSASNIWSRDDRFRSNGVSHVATCTVKLRIRCERSLGGDLAKLSRFGYR
jgi:hypothetical protein